MLIPGFVEGGASPKAVAMSKEGNVHLVIERRKKEILNLPERHIMGPR